MHDAVIEALVLPLTQVAPLLHVAQDSNLKAELVPLETRLV
jgi:hypothetical protein